MNADLWIGSATTLAGAFLGGVISYVLSRQQIREARQQHLVEWRLQSEQSSRDRRFSCYSDFITRARAYRGAVRAISDGALDQPRIQHMDELAAATDATSSLVFLVMESIATYDACRSVLRALRECQSYAHQPSGADASLVMELEDRLAASLREFQAASREELGVAGVARSRILATASEEPASSSEPEAAV